MATENGLRYSAFISYSQHDKRWGSWLQAALERYRVPATLVTTLRLPRRLGRVFLDRTELPSSSDLDAALREALSCANALIVICSPAAAASRWVNEEIVQFQNLGHAHRVFALVVDGEPNAVDPAQECLPPALKVAMDGSRSEPLAADARPGQDRKRDAFLKLVAGMLGVGFDALKQRETQRQQRRMMVIVGALVAAVAYTTTFAVMAVRARNDAQLQRSHAENLLQFMLGDLRDKLRPIGRLDVLDAVGDQAMRYFSEVDPDQLGDPMLSARATALRQIGEVRVERGELTEAAPAFEEALKLDEELAHRHPEDQATIFNVGQSAFYVGYAAYLGQDYDKADALLRVYKLAADRLVALDGSNRKWRLESIYARHNLAQVLRSRARFDEAIQAYLEISDAYRELLNNEPDNLEYMSALADSEAGIVAACLYQDRYAEAMPHSEESLHWLRLYRKRAPDDATAKLHLATYVNMRAEIAGALGQLDAARDNADEAVHLSEELYAFDSSNAQYRREFANALNRAAAVSLLADDLDSAYDFNARARDRVRELLQQTSEISFSHALGTDIELRSVELALRRGDPAAGAVALAAARGIWNGYKSEARANSELQARFALYDAELTAQLATDRLSCPSLGHDADAAGLQPELVFRLRLAQGDVAEAQALWLKVQGKVASDTELSGFLSRWCARDCAPTGWLPCAGRRNGKKAR